MQNFKVLLIDDSKFIHKSFGQFTKELDNFELHGITEGLDTIKTASEFKPDLIFLDYILENTDGLTVLKELKSHPELKQIPILMISSKDNHYDQQLAILHGADQFLQKPLLGDLIREKIRFYQNHIVKEKTSA